MTRMEAIKKYDKKLFATILCNVIEKTFINYENDKKVAIRFCDYCPATDYCHNGHPGFLDWLEEEV